MIVYQNIFKKLSDAGYTSYRLQKEKILSGSTMNRIRQGEPINTDTIDTICTLCECQPGDLMRWEKGQEK